MQEIPPSYVETNRKPPFVFIFIRNLIAGIFLVSISLFAGMLGYHHYEKMSWTDSYVNAAMILSGMGPVTELKTEAGKIFAGSYALFSGIFFLISVAVVAAPLFHRFFHNLHFGQEKTIRKQ
jgi:hypothetical protein